MKQLIMIIFCLVITAGVQAADLSATGAQVIQSAGVKIYPDADFIEGNQDIGFRFATKKSPAEVRAWYKKQLSGWSLHDKFGGWVIYNGKPGVTMGELMSINHVSVKENKMLHEWFGVDPAMSTEIVIMIPKQ
jgi:hypothetical protein